MESEQTNQEGCISGGQDKAIHGMLLNGPEDREAAVKNQMRRKDNRLRSFIAQEK